MLNHLHRPLRAKLVGLALAIIMLVTILPTPSTQAVDLGQSYLLMQRDYPEMVERFKAGGATDANIDAFLADMENDLRPRGTLNEANFNSYMYQSLREVITQRKHRVMFQALLNQFEEEIDYTLDNNELHPDLVPIRNTVMEAVFGGSGEDPGGSTGGGAGGGITAPKDPVSVSLDTIEAVSQEIERQMQTEGDLISLDLSGQNQLISIKASSLQDIWTSSRDLEIKFDGLTIFLSQDSLRISNDNILYLSAAALNQAKQEEMLKNISKAYKVLGQIYEISGTTQNSVGPAVFKKPLTVTFPYLDLSLDGVDESGLDVFYYNESGQWVKMNGTVDREKKTISFTTTHFSKYAVMSYTPSTHKFVDLLGHWAEADVDTMVSIGLVNGISANRFAPDNKITRAEFAAILLRALGIPEGSHVLGRFYDVPAQKWYFNTVNTAAQCGLITGYSDTVFGPEDLVTREQMAVMLKRAMIYKNMDVETDSVLLESMLDRFTDNGQISAWAKDSVAITVDQGIIKGRTPETFAPGASATRAEAAVMILRTYDKL